MSGALETSVTLEEVFIVVIAKRVPLAPELAGYLALEIAEGADAAGGDIDPKFVFIGEEGTVGLVRPRRDGATGSAEGSIRAILARLLDASGSQTPALGATSKRRSTAGLPSLVEELEAALIPVNRAAGRRALARLAREAKRVTLGVGRNASIPAASERVPGRGSSPSYHSVQPTPPSPAVEERAVTSSQRPPTAPASFSSEEDRTHATRDSVIPAELLASHGDAPPAVIPAAPLLPVVAAPPEHDASELPTIQFEPPSRGKGPDSVDSLIASFEVSKKSDQQVGRELKAMVGLEPTPPPPRIGGGGDAEVEALLALSDQSAPVPMRSSAASIPDTPTSAKPTASTAARVASAETRALLTPAPPPPEDRQLPTGPSKLRGRLPTDAPRRSRGGAGTVLVVAVIAIVLAVFALWQLKPGFLSGRTREKIEAEKAQSDQDRQKLLLAQQASACKATLVVTDVPPHAEVLLRVGQAPADVERMPVGTRLEFVATAEGYAPKRTLVPAGASWDTGPDGKARFEVAVQLEKSKAKPGPSGQSDLWPAGDPGSEVGGKGPPGSVHIVSTPKGAELWLLAGVGPEAKIEQLRCDGDIEVLIAGPTSLRKRMHVGAAEFLRQEGDVTGSKSAGGARLARVSAK
jgi:hypothetical protein